MAPELYASTSPIDALVANVKNFPSPRSSMIRVKSAALPSADVMEWRDTTSLTPCLNSFMAFLIP